MPAADEQPLQVRFPAESRPRQSKSGRGWVWATLAGMVIAAGAAVAGYQLGWFMGDTRNAAGPAVASEPTRPAQPIAAARPAEPARPAPSPVPAQVPVPVPVPRPAAAPAPRTLRVSLDTVPPGATAFVRGHVAGDAPFVVTVKEGDRASSVVFRANGYKDRPVELDPVQLLAAGKDSYVFEMQRVKAPAARPQAKPGRKAGLNWDE